MIGILGQVLGKLGGELIDNFFDTEEEKAINGVQYYFTKK